MCFDPATVFNPNGVLPQQGSQPQQGPVGHGYQLYTQEQQALGQSPMSAQEWQAAKQRGEV